MSNDDIQKLLRTAIQAAQSGNKAAARQILGQVTDQDPHNELAWIWMASVAETPTERRICLQRVLEINPRNDRAKQALEKLDAPPESAALQSSRWTEPDQAKPTKRSLDLDREQLLGAAPRPRRRSRLPFLIAIVLAFSMIALGIVMLWDYFQSQDTDPTPTAEIPAAAAIPTEPTRVPDFITPTPRGGTLITLPDVEDLPPTWTPTATWTLPPVLESTPTDVPLFDYTLLFAGKRDEQTEWQLYTMLADSTEEQTINLRLPIDGDESTANLTLIEAFDARFSPDGEMMVLAARVQAAPVDEEATTATEFEELFLASVQDGIISRLTSFEAGHMRDPVWSPDGSRIAFASDIDGDYDIYLINVEGGDARAITHNDAQDNDPSWSPAGAYIAFASDESGLGFLEVWSMTADGGERKQLTNDTNSSYAPAWSPDGTAIVFVSDRRVDADLYMMNADGTGERLLTTDDHGAEDRDPAWSPDGKWIAYISDRDSYFFEIYLIQSDGMRVQRITYDLGDNRNVVWKP